MRTVTNALLTLAYAVLAGLLGVWLWQAGGGWGAAISGFVGALGLAFTIDGQVRRRIGRRDLSGQIDQVREAHVILADQVEQLNARISTLSQSLSVETEELTDEVRILEDLVLRLSQGVEQRAMAQPAAIAAAAADDERVVVSPQVSQRNALIDTVRAALEENRVDLYLQPVVSLPQRRTVFYESYSRLRDDTGRVMMPAEYLSVAEPEGLISAIDNLLLFRCVQIVRRLAGQDRQVGIFCNISLASLADEAFFPQFLDFLAQNQDLRGSLIFELGQSAFNERGSVEARNMAKLADLGFKFSIDKVSDLLLDFQDLNRADVKYLKVAADVLLTQLHEREERLSLKPMPDISAADFANIARRYGVEVVAEKVENERQVVDVLDLNVAYGEGHLFGQPRAIRDAVLAEAPPAPATVQGVGFRRAVG
jgi:cyclic-di-GMP phosphodiesterase, flagellum assembly factor TipF